MTIEQALHYSFYLVNGLFSRKVATAMAIESKIIELKNTGTITKITAEGEQSNFSNLVNINGIAINNQDELFVTSYNNSAVYKVLPNGESELWLQGHGLNAPVGIALDENGNIYVGNYENGSIFKIDSAKSVTELGSSPDSYGNAYITYANGMVYATGINYRLLNSKFTDKILIKNASNFL